jgi:hypothetical protein
MDETVSGPEPDWYVIDGQTVYAGTGAPRLVAVLATLRGERDD